MCKVFVTKAAAVVIIAIALEVAAFPQVAIGSGAPNTGITPFVTSVETGSSSGYVTNSTVHAPYTYESLWQGAPAGSYNSLWAARRIDVITEWGMDVAAGSALSGVANHPTLHYCGTTSTCANTAETSAIEVFGDVAFPTAATVTLSGLPYTSASTYACTAGDRTTATSIVNATTYTDGAHVIFTESGRTNTDHARNHCVGY